MSVPIDVSATPNPQNGAPPDTTAVAAQPQIGAATDAPWFTFPPFPKPPPGVTIIPFKSFKPRGIYVVEEAEGDALSGPERVEYDATGIPTVMLASQHSLTAAERKKRTNKRLKKVEKNQDGTVRRLMWYEEWEAGETQRRTMVDPSMLRVDRLHQASHDFKNGRPWPALPSGVPQLWDHFRLYIGLISSIQPPPGVKRMKQLQAMTEAAEGGESDDDSDDAMDGNTKPEKSITIVDEEKAREIQEDTVRNARPRKGPFNEEERQLRREDFREARDSRMDLFFNDTETCIKVFFSGFYRDKGLIWSEQRARDGPILIGFFLKFLLRSRVLPEPEHEKGLRKALLVVEQAQKELPQTFVMGRALPDHVGAGCEAIWGCKGQTMYWANDEGNTTGAQERTEEPDAKRRKLDEDETVNVLKDVVGEDAKVEVLTPETIAAIEKDVRKGETTAEADASGTPDGGWGASGWGNVGDTNGDTNESWNSAEADAWAGDGGSAWDIELQPNPLMAHLGATALPFTHTTGVVERSTRKIVSIAPAIGLATTKAEKKRLRGLTEVGLIEDDLNARLAKMSLAPCPVLGSHKASDVLLPEIMQSSRGPVVKEELATVDEATPKPHNPFKDTITVLLDPAVADKMFVGMHLGGAWVQIARQIPGEGDKDEAGEPTGFWYVEQLTSILPSYHTENYT